MAETTTKPENAQMERFQTALRRVMAVSKDDMSAMLANKDAIASVAERPGPKPRRGK